MTTIASRADRLPASQADADARSEAPLHQAVPRQETIEWTIFWAFIAALAWTPFWYGSNDLVAWGANAVLFPGLAAGYEISILLRGVSHPIAVRNFAVAAALFAAVVLWVAFQIATSVPSALVHPIWAMAADALASPIEGSISVNRDLTTLALMRLITAASAFWIAVQLCRNPARANLLIMSIAVIGCVYAAYGIGAFVLKVGHVPWMEIPSTHGFTSSTFINRNSFATYAGIGLIALCGLILRFYRREVTAVSGPPALRIALFIAATGERGAALLGGAFVIVVALLLTGSRGGIVATGLGLFVLGVLTFSRSEKRATEPVAIVIFGTVLVAVALFAFGDALVDNIARRGLNDTSRMAVYLITLRSILDAPLQGFGYGTFGDVFPIYRDRSIGVAGTWEQAHNTYLEVFQGLGLVFGSSLIAVVVLLALRCLKGALTRQENVTVPRVAAGVAFLVGAHALVDFSLQIQAVTLTFTAVLGAGTAQSQSSRLALED